MNKFNFRDFSDSLKTTGAEVKDAAIQLIKNKRPGAAESLLEKWEEFHTLALSLEDDLGDAHEPVRVKGIRSVKRVAQAQPAVANPSKMPYVPDDRT